MGVARKGFFFTFDAILASVLIVMALLLYLQLGTSTTNRSTGQLFGEDVLLSLEEIRLRELQPDPFIETMLLTYHPELTENHTVTYALGFLWVKENITGYQGLASMIDVLVPPRVTVVLSMEGNEIYRKDGLDTGRVVSVAHQQITGIDEGEPVSGSSATAYIMRVQNKQTSEFAYFGGYVGKGNITVALELPNDVVPDKVLSLELELDTPGSFSIEVNGQFCDGLLTPVMPSKVPDTWDVTACKSLLVPGRNTFFLRFPDKDSAYVAGGFVKVTFFTDLMTREYPTTRTRYQFPKIEGVVNFFDGVIVPETIHDMTIFIDHETIDTGRFFPPFRSYLTIGEREVYNESRDGRRSLTITSADLLARGVNFAEWSNTTLPIRFAAFNASTEVRQGGDADVVLITDYSASMMKSISDNEQGNVGGINYNDCENSVYLLPSIRRQVLARCLDIDAVNIIMDDTVTNNRIWSTVYWGRNFGTERVYTYDNPTDKEALLGHFKSTPGSLPAKFPSQGSGKTCISCALSEAQRLFNTYSDADRNKFVILLSDGLPTHCSTPDESCDQPGTSYGDEACIGFCDTTGQSGCDSGSVTFCDLTDTRCDPAVENAKEVGRQLADDGVTIFTVGFGPVENCDKSNELLQYLADISGGIFNHSSDPLVLRDVYRNFSETIINSLQMVGQDVVLEGDYAPSILYDTSYIEIEHAMAFDDEGLNEIEITRQTPQFGMLGPACAPTVPLPMGVRFRQAHIVSYSGANWTDLLKVNGNVVYNLSVYPKNYSSLGDPFRVGVPIHLLTETTALSLNTADFEGGYAGCSPSNSMIYSIFVKNAVARTEVLPKATGCIWNIDLDEGGAPLRISVPETYEITNPAPHYECNYTAAAFAATGGVPQYDGLDTIQVAVARLLQQIDFDNDGRIFLSLSEESLRIIVLPVSTVPYLWGPVRLRIEVTQ